MPRCEYSYYVTLLPCNQFHWGGHRGGQSSHRGAVAPLATPKNRLYLVVIITYLQYVHFRISQSNATP